MRHTTNMRQGPTETNLTKLARDLNVGASAVPFDFETTRGTAPALALKRYLGGEVSGLTEGLRMVLGEDLSKMERDQVHALVTAVNQEAWREIHPTAPLMEISYADVVELQRPPEEIEKTASIHRAQARRHHDPLADYREGAAAIDPGSSISGLSPTSAEYLALFGPTERPYDPERDRAPAVDREGLIKIAARQLGRVTRDVQADQEGQKIVLVDRLEELVKIASELIQDHNTPVRSILQGVRAGTTSTEAGRVLGEHLITEIESRGLHAARYRVEEMEKLASQDALVIDRDHPLLRAAQRAEVAMLAVQANTRMEEQIQAETLQLRMVG